MKEWTDSKVGLVGDVDCTASGESLCTKIGVEGYPTIKWGDPDSLEDFEGERDLKSLKKFAKENLKPVCSVKNMDLCDDEKKAAIVKIQAMPEADLTKQIEEQEASLKAAEDEFNVAVKQLQEKYEKLEATKTEKLSTLKKEGNLGLMKAVKSSLAASTSQKSEL